jgi:hypothetical protein
MPDANKPRADFWYVWADSEWLWVDEQLVKYDMEHRDLCSVYGFRFHYPIVTVFADVLNTEPDADGKRGVHPVELTFSLHDMPADFAAAPSPINLHIHVHGNETTVENLAARVNKELLKRQRQSVSLGFH